MSYEDRSSKKPKARDEFKSYFDLDTEGVDFDNCSDKLRSKELLRFYLFQIYNKLRTEIDEEDFNAGFVDNANDLGIDFIHRDDGVVTIIQAKYRAAKKLESIESIGHFQGIFSRLQNPKFNANPQLADALANVNLNADTFRLIYLTTGRIADQARKQADAVPSYPCEIAELNDRCEWIFLDEAGLDEEFRNALSVASSGLPDTEDTIFATGKAGSRSPIIEINQGRHRSCVLVVDATQLVKLANRYKDGLFSLNIRNFLGNTSHNKSIITTAVERPDDFYFFNNGISCLVKTLTISDDSINVTGIQVINGAQTVKSLVRASKASSSWPKSKPAVLVRVTEIPEGYGSNKSFRNEVTRYNNTQNIVKVSDFHSNDLVQTNLCEQFRTIKRFGKPAHYMPKRSDRPIAQAEVIRLEEFAKVIYSFLHDPTGFAGSTSFLFDDAASGGYSKVFGDGEQPWDKMPEEEFRLRAAIWWIGKEFGMAVAQDRKKSIDPVERNSLERKWTVIFAAQRVMARKWGSDYLQKLAKHYRGEWHLGGSDDLSKEFGAIYDAAKRTVVYVYRQAVKNPDFVHRNWMRSKKTAVEIADFVRDAPMLF